MHPFDPTSLRLFVAVCEERNIALAAQREAIVPSAVSKRIAQMEAQAGTPLLERGRRGVGAQHFHVAEGEMAQGPVGPRMREQRPVRAGQRVAVHRLAPQGRKAGRIGRRSETRQAAGVQPVELGMQCVGTRAARGDDPLRHAQQVARREGAIAVLRQPLAQQRGGQAHAQHRAV